jgi:hypothetical protein
MAHVQSQRSVLSQIKALEVVSLLPAYVDMPVHKQHPKQSWRPACTSRKPVSDALSALPLPSLLLNTALSPPSPAHGTCPTHLHGCVTKGDKGHPGGVISTVLVEVHAHLAGVLTNMHRKSCNYPYLWGFFRTTCFSGTWRYAHNTERLYKLGASM